VIRVSRNQILAVLGIAAFALSGCGHAGSSGKAGGAGALGEGQASASASAGGVGELGSRGTPSPSTGTTSGNSGGGPQIVYFKVAQQPLCPIVGTSAAPYSRPEQPVRLAWKVTGASGIALSIDDPTFFQQHHSGTYGSYGTQGTIDLSFPCATNTTKRTTTHTYTINTLGGNSKGKTISVTAQNP
jgi:hypothetical protein